VDKMPYLISYDEVIYQAMNKRLSRKIVNHGLDELFELRKSLERIERESKIPYPPIIIIPEARLMLLEEGLSAIIYANLSIRRFKGRITPIVELLLPFLLYGAYSSKTAVLAHELLHYIYLAIKSYMNEYFIHPLISTSDITGRIFLEEVYHIDPDLLFGGRRLSRLLRKFEEVLRKDRIAYKIRRNWINRGLPTKAVLSKDFKLNISIEEMSKLHFPSEVMSRVSEIIHEQGFK
jgi:hypothetical protein